MLNDLEWSFCVKIWSVLGIRWAGVLAFGENCSEICRATHYCQRQKCSPARDCTGDIRLMELFTGVTEQEASNQWTVFTVLHPQFSDTWQIKMKCAFPGLRRLCVAVLVHIAATPASLSLLLLSSSPSRWCSLCSLCRHALSGSPILTLEVFYVIF